ncbi:PH domain-containing protein [Wenzhouxiangella sp. XN201]|uniref:PH domain-containing protein n=1 Tax=Wenzhouxiangella sp. XN201 TaxID=2710755 RepID=UPI0013CC3C42|nr:PH domain-containing protein [Wenzhouxiangella sp. XN201]NEZ03652.1 PH domain-containing protein [Wenzhouxiangella sp. XN201]
MEQTEIFSNRQVAATDLPDFRRVELTSVAPAYLPWALVTQTAIWLILAAAAAVAGLLPFDLGGVSDWSQRWLLPLPALAMAVAGAVYARLDFRTRAWALREHDLICRYGVLWRKTVIMPFARIQHVEAVHGPLERYLGLMRLKCFTAGGMSADLTVKGLDRASARRVRQYLLEQIAATADDDDSPVSLAGGEESGRDVD